MTAKRARRRSVRNPLCRWLKHASGEARWRYWRDEEDRWRDVRRRILAGEFDGAIIGRMDWYSGFSYSMPLSTEEWERRRAARLLQDKIARNTHGKRQRKL